MHWPVRQATIKRPTTKINGKRKQTTGTLFALTAIRGGRSKSEEYLFGVQSPKRLNTETAESGKPDLMCRTTHNRCQEPKK